MQKILGPWFLTFCMTYLPAVVYAQSQADVYKEDIQQARAFIAEQRKNMIEKNMQLTPAESVKFWDLYSRYQAELQPVYDQKVKLITDYADAYVNKSLTDGQALSLLNTFFENERNKLKIRESYIDQYREILPPKKVARFFQIENKLDAIRNYDTARKVPLVE